MPFSISQSCKSVDAEGPAKVRSIRDRSAESSLPAGTVAGVLCPWAVSGLTAAQQPKHSSGVFSVMTLFVIVSGSLWM
jgi:hypothetical protein